MSKFASYQTHNVVGGSNASKHKKNIGEKGKSAGNASALGVGSGGNKSSH